MRLPLITGVVALVATITLPAFAKGPGQELAPGRAVSDAAKEKNEQRGRGQEQRLEAAGQGRERSCQAHEASIQRRSERLVRMATNMMNVFDKILQRVQNFYDTKVVPAGGSVANYDDLVADIDAKKTAVNDALAQAQATADSFDCDAENPKETLHQFRLDMQAVKRALHAYRTSIRNLIVAVHRVAVDVVEESPSPSPTP